MKSKSRVLAVIFSVILVFCIWFFIDVYYNTSSIRHIENWNFNPASKLDSRIGNIPVAVLEYLKEYDNRDDYSEYSLSMQEKQLILDVVDQLPPLLKQTIKDRLTGLYFINNFLGSGLTDWIIDDENNFYGYMVYNPVVLQKNLSQLLTWKENTTFIPDTKEMSLSIDCGTNNGFLYILLHEAVHLADYSYHLTPYVEDAVTQYTKGPILLKAETNKYWLTYDKPVSDFSDRKNITFYGFNQGPKIPLSSSISLYRSLGKTPFPSLYASQNWAEDLSELLSLYHLTVKMGCPYQVIIHKNHSKLIFEPVANTKVRERFKYLEIFYTQIDKYY